MSRTDKMNAVFIHDDVFNAQREITIFLLHGPMQTYSNNAHRN